jgi:hypothetical protein
MRCPNCGSEVREGANFCAACGSSIGTVAHAPAPDYTAPYSAPAAAATRQSSWVPTTSLVLGIIAIVLSLLACLPIIGYCACVEPLVGIGAVVLGIIGRSDPEVSERKKATWGIILGIVGTIIMIALLILGLVLGVGLGILGELGQSWSY